MPRTSTPTLEFNELSINHETELIENSQYVFTNNKNITILKTEQPNSLDFNMTDDFNGLDLTKIETGTMEKLYSALRTPDIIRELTEFTGDIKQLYRFINEVEDIIIICKSMLPKDTDVPVTFIKAIRNKIRGGANEVLIAHNTSSTEWDEIKETLRKHYSDPRSEIALIRDLHRTRQGNQTSRQFHSRITEIQTALISHASLHGNNETKRELYQEMCLAQFVANLKEPLGSNIRSRGPETLTEALDTCLEEEDMYYIKYRPPIQRFQQSDIQGKRPTVTFKEQKSVTPYQQTPGTSTGQQTRNWIPKEEWNANRGRLPAIKIEKHINCTETTEEIEPEESENESPDEKTEEFFRIEASEDEEE